MVAGADWKFELIVNSNVETLPQIQYFVLPASGDKAICDPEQMPAMLRLDCSAEESQGIYDRLTAILKENGLPMEIPQLQENLPQSFLIHGVGLAAGNIYLLGHVPENGFHPK